MKKFSAVLAAVILAAASPAGALEWTVLGPRALGMGGAGVALPQGPIASYWNPAALGRPTENAYGFQLPVTVHAGLTGDVITGANDLKNAKDSCPTVGAATCQANINSALRELNQPGNGLRADIGAGGDFKIGRLAIFGNGFVDAGAVPSVDLVNTAPGTINSNTSSLIIKGARILEFGAGYGHELPFARGVYLGGNLKLMKTQVGYANFQVINNNNGNQDVLKTLKNGAVTSNAIGVDAGALWDVNRSFESVPLHPRFGLVGRNLNNPKFSQPAAAAANGVTGKYAVNPQLRMGASITPFHWWNIAADMDLTRNLTPVDNVASREAGVGTEINVFNRTWINIPLRVGVSRNLAESGSGTMLSGGFGLNFLHFMIDASGSVSPKSIHTQTQGKDQKIPRELAAAVQIGILFGGSEEEARETPEEPAPAPADAQPVSTQQVEKVRADAEKAQKELDKAAHEGTQAPAVQKPVEPSSDPHKP